MTPLEKLIRYHRFLLDEKRRALREQEEQAARLQAALEGLESEILAEQAVAGRSAEVGFAYGGYAARATRRRAGLRSELRAAGQAVAQARDALAQAFEVLKRYEIAKEARDHAARLDAARREQIELDEIALTQHNRRIAEGGQ